MLSSPSAVSEVAEVTGVEAVVDVVRYVWPMLECDEVVASPEYDVS